jgi:hypothetical protein
MPLVNPVPSDYRLPTTIDPCPLVEETRESLAEGITLISPVAEAQAAGCIQATVTAIRTTATVSPTKTVRPTATPTTERRDEVVALQAADPPPTAAEGEPGAWSLWLGLTLALIVVGGVIWWLAGLPSTRLPGEIEVYKKGVFQFSVVLSTLKKRVIRVGSGAVEIVLAGEDMPALAARIVPQQNPQGQRQAIWELLDPDNPQTVLERQSLAHEDVVYLGDYQLIYRHYQAEPSFFEGSIVNVSQ